MRIRKRQEPLPLSLLSPVPISDLHLFSRSSVQPDSNLTAPSDDHHDSDLRHVIRTDSALRMKLKEHLDFEGEADIQLGERRTDKEKNSNDISKGSMLGADDNNGVLLQPPQISTVEVVSRWCYGDKTVPLKKRIRGSRFHNAVSIHEGPVDGNMDEEKKVGANIMRMKCKINKTWVQEDGIDKEEDRERKDRTDNRGNKNNTINNNNTINGSSSTSTVVGGNKKSKRGSTIMEGSRCSRVNGRGWRCSQPTLVGYSLCEHHLGKGRLRSMTNMRNSHTMLASKKVKISEQRISAGAVAPPSTLYDHGKQEEKSAYAISDGGRGSGVGKDDEDFAEKDKDDEKPPSMKNSKKRVKLGMVKARSLSSLLGQTNRNSGLITTSMEDHDN
ncbi:hypothetical protein Ancab_030928 [Ancistrocladus abbreviatus]